MLRDPWLEKNLTIILETISGGWAVWAREVGEDETSSRMKTRQPSSVPYLMLEVSGSRGKGALIGLAREATGPQHYSSKGRAGQQHRQIPVQPPSKSTDRKKERGFG